MSILDTLSQSFASACGVELYPPEPGTVVTMLDWMERSALGTCVAESSAYYVMLAVHSLGLATLVGAMMMVDLRILGAARGISARALPGFVKLGGWGLLINAISGVIIFFSQANKMFHHGTFRWKLFLILVGLISTWWLARTVLKPAATRDAAILETGGAKAQAIFSLGIWVAVIVVGRMIAYLKSSV